MQGYVFGDDNSYAEFVVREFMWDTLESQTLQSTWGKVQVTQIIMYEISEITVLGIKHHTQINVETVLIG